MDSRKASSQSWAAKARKHVFVLSAGGMVLLSANVGLRDWLQHPQIGVQLIGTWQTTGVINAGRELPMPAEAGPDVRLTLHADGRAAAERV